MRHTVLPEGECFLCRVVGDQFVLYLSCRDEKGPLHYADTLCRRFEQYQAKQNGRNQYVFCDNLRRYAQAVPAGADGCVCH